MSDKDREAFEKWFYPELEKQHPANPTHWEAWQAARDHYAPKENDERWTRAWNAAMDYAAKVNTPKLTEKEAAEIMAKSMADLMNQGSGFDGLPEFRKEGWKNQARAGLAALRAAGVPFKEEA